MPPCHMILAGFGAQAQLDAHQSGAPLFCTSFDLACTDGDVLFLVQTHIDMREFYKPF